MDSTPIPYRIPYGIGVSDVPLGSGLGTGTGEGEGGGCKGEGGWQDR